MYIIVALVIIETFIYFYAGFNCETHVVGLGFIDPVMLVLRASFAYSRFVVEKFTVKKKNQKNKTKKCIVFTK